MEMTHRRLWLIVMSLLTVSAIIGTAALAFYVDREQCKATVQAIDNSRTMWEYAVQQNPSPRADAFLAEMNRRIPPAHCEGGKLVVDEAVTTPTTTGAP